MSPSSQIINNCIIDLALLFSDWSLCSLNLNLWTSTIHKHIERFKIIFSKLHVCPFPLLCIIHILNLEQASLFIHVFYFQLPTMQTSEIRVATSNVMWKLNVITKLIFNLIYYWVISMNTHRRSVDIIDQKEEVSRLSKWESWN